jgi:hypothetical protein
LSGKFFVMKLALFLLCCVVLLPFQATPQSTHFPAPEKLTYLVEWRLINAGTATVQLVPEKSAGGWNFDLNVVSAGLVSRLYRVLDTYRIGTTEKFCLVNAVLDAQEGKKHTVTKLNVDRAHNRVSYEEHDLVRNKTEQKNLDVAPCTYDIVGALASLRMANMEPGRTITVPITDGKKFAQVRVAGQARERITAGGKSYDAVRCEASVFDGVLYRRRGRLLVWLSNEPDHVPLQFRLLLGFPIGSVTVSLQKQEH